MADTRENRTLNDELEAVGRGDPTAFARLYAATSATLYAHCLSVTGSREGSEDVLQEVYIKIWNRAAGFDRSKAGALTWLRAIARNSAIDWHRARGRRPTSAIDDAIALPDQTENAEARLVREGQEQKAVAMLADLNNDQAMFVRGAFVGGLTYAELAEREGVPLGTVKSRIRRGLLQMRARWGRDD